MQTNLLGRLVTVDDSCTYNGEVVAIYPDGNDIIKFGILDTNGNFHFGIAPQYVKIHRKNVYLHFRISDQKIQAIKLVRQYKEMGLKEAKDYVEESINPILLAENLEPEELKNILAEITYFGMEAEVI